MQQTTEQIVKPIIDHIPQQAKLIGDGISISTILATFMGWVPHLAAIASLIWACMRCYDAWLDIQAKRKAAKKDS